MNRAEMLHMAKREVEARRQRAETDALAARAAIYAKVPDLALLDEQQAALGTAAAGLAADGQPAAARAKLDMLRQLRQRRALMLQQAGYTEDDLQPRYTCPVCSDTGLASGAVCGCVTDEVKRLRREEINHTGALRLCRFETFSLEVYPEQMDGVAASPRAWMAHVLQDCRDYAADFGVYSPSLLMYGDAGLGKTHLALSIATEVLERGWDVIYVSAQSAFASVSAERFNDGGDVFASMLGADLLVLDDLGTEYLDAYTSSKLYELINGRLGRRPTIYTTNICRHDTLHQKYTEKIASRLLGECEPIRFFGQDLRLQRRREKHGN